MLLEAMAEQLPLRLALDDQARFDSFHPGSNDEVVAHLQTLARGEAAGPVYLWGAPGSGRSHLLQATCRATAEAGHTTLYLPLRDPDRPPPEALEGLENLALLAIDDIDAVAGEGPWEEALFHLYNHCREGGARLLVSGCAAPGALPLRLADLRSRLGWGLVLRLAPLSDEDKAAALVHLARLRGLLLPPETAHYLLRRCPRDMATLVRLLEALDQASLAARRALTIPFVSAFLARQPQWQVQAGLFDQP